MQVYVTFEVSDQYQFFKWLQLVEADAEKNGHFIGALIGWRADDALQRRASLQAFADKMETILRKHDHKDSWRNDPIEMLVRKLKLELMEFEVAYDFQRWEDARNEAVDLANFCLIVYDRLGQPDMKT